MPTLTIRNVPDDLHRMLKERARRNRRSLNQEVIAELALIPGASDEVGKRWELANAVVDAMRSKMTRFMTADEIAAAIEEGRR